MLKKAYLLVLVLLCAAFASCGGGNRAAAPGGFTPLLPNGAVFYAQITGANQVWAELETTKLVQQVRAAADKIRAAVEKKGDYSEQSSELKELETALGTKINTAFFAGLLGKQTEIALYAKPGEEEPDVIMVTAPDGKAQLETLINQLLQKDADSTRESQTIDGKEIFTLTMKSSAEDADPAIVHYAFTAEGCIFSNNLEQVKLLAAGKASDDGLMARAPELRELPDASGAFAVMLVDLSRLADMIESSANNDGTAADPGMTANLSMMRGQGPVVFTSTYKQGLLRFRTKTTLAPSADKKLRDIIMSAKHDPEGFNWLPAGVLMFAGATVPLEQTLRLTMDTAKGGEESFFSGLMQEFSKGLGVDIEKELLPALGHEYLITITGVDFGGMFPVPQLALLCQVKDGKQMLAIMDKVIQSPTLAPVREKGMSFIDEEIDGVQVKYMPLPLGENLSPGYAVKDNMLIIAASKGIIGQLVKAHAAGDDVRTTNSMLKQAAAGHAKMPNNYGFFDNKQFVAAAVKAFNMYRMFIPETIPADAVLELLNGLGNLESVYASAAVDGETTQGVLDIRIN